MQARYRYAIPIAAVAMQACLGATYPWSIFVSPLKLACGLSQAAAPVLIRTPNGLYALAAIAGFNYGGVLVLYALTAAHRWGPQHVGQIYCWLFSANIIASFAPTLAAYSYDRVETFCPSLLLLAGLLVGATIVARPLWAKNAESLSMATMRYNAGSVVDESYAQL